MPPSPSPHAPVSLRPSPGVVQPRVGGGGGGGQVNTRTGEARRLEGNEQSGGLSCKSEPTQDEKGVLYEKK